MEFVGLTLSILNLSFLLPRTVFTSNSPIDCRTFHIDSVPCPQAFSHNNLTYSKETLYALRPSTKTHLQPDVLSILRTHNICSVRKTRRGKKGGRKKIKVTVSKRCDELYRKKTTGGVNKTI